MKKTKDRKHLDLGRRIAKLRRAKGWNQDELSARSGVAISSLKDIERGVSEGYLDTRRDLAKALGCSISDFYGVAEAVQVIPENLFTPEARELWTAWSQAEEWQRMSALFLLTLEESYLDNPQLEKWKSSLLTALRFHGLRPRPGGPKK